VASSRLDDLTARARATIAATGALPVTSSGCPEAGAPSLVVLGIDPGLATTGYGVVSGPSRADGAYVALAYGTIETLSTTPVPLRLAAIHEQASALLRRFQPSVVAIERLFFGANATTAMAVGQARGVLVLAAAQATVPVVEYTPLEVKSALAGFGRAPKAQMQRMVQALLALGSLPRPDDAADGLAIALAHLRFAAKRHLRDAVAD
jgi:crossover junction endodeoxyribonuclease RuvC